MTKLELILSMNSQPQKVLTLVGDFGKLERGTGVSYNDDDLGGSMAYR